ncbi:ATPase WRNIP1-like [Bacillus rossius redtenbacheri]|uniref:ATPase WRNIP1-like n=1 Tax=Bacillus rossius redtenbacheri TaxID=93214 RepID=UPI002FDDB273
MSSCGSDFIPCPICFKLYSSKDIEGHANKCLFLSSETINASQSLKEVSPRLKRQKKDHCSNDLASSSTKHVAEEELEMQGSSDGGAPQLPSRLVDLSVPLAEQMRPSDFGDYVGQSHVLGRDTILRSLLERQDIPSMILWGPPGCGKTTLAHILAKKCRNGGQGLRFVKLSATMSGVNDIKEAVKVAKNEVNFKRRTVLFMDEIHRFNKLQQDIFLPHVEDGTIVLIGATTENPSFSLNSALLSRCKVIVLEKLRTENLVTILQRAVVAVGGAVLTPDVNGCQDNKLPRVVVDEETVQWLAEICDGDARIALNSLQLALQSKDIDVSSVARISLDDIKDGIKRSHLLYDKKGEEHYNIISAMHKSIRASDDNAALYWLTRMLEGGEDPIFIARRLVRAASEDIGLADPMAVTMAVSAMQGCQLLGMPECDVLLAQCAVYLARAEKSVEVYHALLKAKESVSQHRGALPSVPLHLRNAPTRLMKDLGYGKGYNTSHKDESSLEYMPEGLEHINFFH